MLDDIPHGHRVKILHAEFRNRMRRSDAGQKPDAPVCRESGFAGTAPACRAVKMEKL